MIQHNIDFYRGVNRKDYRVFKSLKHSDGTMFEGYFIVMLIHQNKQMSYHYKLKYWDLFQIPTEDICPEYDGHTSKDTIERLMKL